MLQVLLQEVLVCLQVLQLLQVEGWDAARHAGGPKRSAGCWWHTGQAAQAQIRIRIHAVPAYNCLSAVLFTAGVPHCVRNLLPKTPKRGLYHPSRRRATNNDA